MLNFHWMQRIHWPNTSEGLVEMAKQLEDANIESVLMPYGPGGNDFSMFLPDIFRSTKKIRIIIAAAAYAVTPEYVAKTFFTAQKFGDNRVDLNLVAGRYSDEFEQIVIDKYPGDSSLVDTHTKRVEMTEKWMEKFVDIIKDERYTTKLMVVGSSETTIRIANNYTDYMIINGDILIDGKRGQLTNTKPILVKHLMMLVFIFFIVAVKATLVSPVNAFIASANIFVESFLLRNRGFRFIETSAVCVVLSTSNLHIPIFSLSFK